MNVQISSQEITACITAGKCVQSPKFSHHFVYLELLKPSKHVKEETDIDSIEYELVKKQNPKQLKRCVLVKLAETG